MVSCSNVAWPLWSYSTRTRMVSLTSENKQRYRARVAVLDCTIASSRSCRRGRLHLCRLGDHYGGIQLGKACCIRDSLISSLYCVLLVNPLRYWVLGSGMSGEHERQACQVYGSFTAPHVAKFVDMTTCESRLLLLA
ncbi:hypothetical protein GQ53DRAFT_318975 [Thozetella sp. PMI_491]|nr:hypothetical protein GQ53DRAFT_318975 [Thozetella sp. PMI_491]